MTTKYLLREDHYFAGKLEDFEYPREAVERSMKNLHRICA